SLYCRGCARILIGSSRDPTLLTLSSSDHFLCESDRKSRDTMEVAMTRQGYLGVVCATLIEFVALPGAKGLAQEAAADSSEAVTAATDGPELVAPLSKELGSTADQAAGPAGGRFGLAKTKLKSEEWTQVANAVPDVASLLKGGAAAAGVGPAG